MLGFNRTHHMFHVSTDPEGVEVREWTRALRAKYRRDGTFTKRDWDRLLGDCQGCLDYPSALFAADLARLYPEAKVVLLNRDPDRWYESMRETVAVFRTPPGFVGRAKRLWCRLLLARVRHTAAFWDEIDFAEGGFDYLAEKDRAVSFMQRSYDECRRVVAAERRIEWTVQDGWAPLCAHLGVAVPTVEDPQTGVMVPAPFPRINDRRAFQQNVEQSVDRMVAAANEVAFGVLGRTVALGAVGYGAYLVWKMAAAARR